MFFRDNIRPPEFRRLSLSKAYISRLPLKGVYPFQEKVL